MKSGKKKVAFLGLSISIEVCLIIAISIACALPGFAFYIFYSGVFGLLLCVMAPLIYVQKKGETLKSLGIFPLGIKQGIVILAFVVFSIGGQSIPLIMDGVVLQWEYLWLGFFPLIMTTFFEELLFRGFFQTRFEKLFGSVPAVILSGLFFSLYHIGYPGFRNLPDLALLFAVGVGFALAYKLSDNNLVVSYLVNLPNALLTYLLKQSQFPVFDIYSVVIAGITLTAICAIMIKGSRIIRLQIDDSQQR